MIKALALLMLLPDPGARALPAQASDSRDRDAVVADASGIIAEMDPLLKELDALRQEEVAASDAELFFAKHKSLRHKLDALLKRLRDDQAKLIRLTRQRALAQAVGLVTDSRSQTHGKADARLASALRDTDLESRVSAYKRLSMATIGNESVAWEDLKARSARRKEDKELWYFVAAIVAAVGGLLAAAWRLRASSSGAAAAPEEGLPQALPSPGLAGDAPSADILVGPYRLLSGVGTSPYGPVCSAEGPEGRQALLQFVEAAPPPGPERTAFLAALRRAASPRHGNIAPMLSVAGDDSRFALAFDCWPSRSLRQVLDLKSCPPAWAKAALLQAARGLACAHAAGVVHGGLTPDDLRLPEDGAVRLTNLGLGPALRAAWRRTSWRGQLGAPAYLAPEQELGKDLPQSDVFSIGVILYEMAVGSAPFLGPNFAAQKREQAWPPPSSLASGWPSSVDALVAKAMHPDPSRRHATCQELIKALEAL